ncbi:MAG: PLP-dependent aminotransferase family protein [Actinomycetota bacterium]
MLELHLELPPGRGRRAAIEAALRDAVRAGRLQPGTRLPSSRSLASDLGVSRSTVVEAYQQLTAEGFLTSQQGDGTAVAAVRPTESAEPDDDLLGPNPTWDFRPGEPDASSFPAREWRRSVRHALEDDGHRAVTYPDPRGRPELRRSLGDYVARTRAVVAEPSSVFVYGGFAAGLGFLADTFRRIGLVRVAVEEAMLPLHRMVLRMAGLEVDVISVDVEGLVVEQLEQSEARAVLVTPSNHYPYCVTMSPARRAALVAWAEAVDGWIIEDDYDGEFRYDRRPIGALQSLAPHRVVYAGTASKSLGAGLRLGWLVVPEPLRQPLTATANLRAGVSAIDQLALADLIERGALDRHVRSMRRTYGERRTALIERLARDIPALTPAPSQAGLHLTVPVPSPDMEARLVAVGETNDVGLLGLTGFHRAPPERAGLAIGFSRPAQHAFAVGLDRLVEVCAEVVAEFS